MPALMIDQSFAHICMQLRMLARTHFEFACFGFDACTHARLSCMRRSTEAVLNKLRCVQMKVVYRNVLEFKARRNKGQRRAC